MKAKLLTLATSLVLLTGCTALEHKCNFIPGNCCGRSDYSYTYCGGDCGAGEKSCINGSCGKCWRCDNQFNDS